MVKHLPINGAEYYRPEILDILDKIQYCKDFLGIYYSVGREWKVTVIYEGGSKINSTEAATLAHFNIHVKFNNYHKSEHVLHIRMYQ